MALLTISANVQNNLPGVAPNDIFLNSQGDIEMAIDLQAIIQNCAQAAKTVLGEMVLNINQGIPYFDAAFAGTPNLEQFTSALRQAFLAVTDVIEVVSLITSTEGNILSYTAVIRTIYGNGGLSGSV